MKKIIVFTSLLLVMSVLGIVFVFADVNSEADNVTYNIIDRYGDRSAAYGANIAVEYEHSNNMYWNADIDIAENDIVDSAFDFRYHHRYENEVRFGGITPYSSMHYSLNRNDPNAEGLDKAYKEIYDSTPYGTEKTVTVKIADYYDYYPISVTINIPGHSYRSIDPSNRAGYQSVIAKDISDTFNSFFKIPVSEKDTIEITVDKDDSDGMVSNSIQTNYYNLSSDCVLGEDTCYIYIGNANADNTRADTSLIPGGYGIYAIEFGDEYEYGIDLNSLRNVFSLPENENVTSLSLSEEKELLYIFTQSNFKSYIYVVSTNGYAELQKYAVELPVFYHITEGEDFFLLYGDDTIELIELEDNGMCKTAFTSKRAYYIDASFHDLYSSASVDYNGDKLICVDHLHEGRYRSLELCSFYVSVYDKTGLIYYGEYNCSLSANPNPSSYSYNILPSSVNYIKVEWQD